MPLLEDFSGDLSAYTGDTDDFTLDSSTAVAAGQALHNNTANVGITHTEWEIEYGESYSFYFQGAGSSEGDIGGLYLGDTRGGLSSMSGVVVGADVGYGSIDIATISGGSIDWEEYASVSLDLETWQQYEVIVDDPSQTGAEYTLRLLDGSGNVDTEISNTISTYPGTPQYIGFATSASSSHWDEVETTAAPTFLDVSFDGSASGTADLPVSRDRNFSLTGTATTSTAGSGDGFGVSPFGTSPFGVGDPSEDDAGWPIERTRELAYGAVGTTAATIPLSKERVVAFSASATSTAGSAPGYGTTGYGTTGYGNPPKWPIERERALSHNADASGIVDLSATRNRDLTYTGTAVGELTALLSIGEETLELRFDGAADATGDYTLARTRQVSAGASGSSTAVLELSRTRTPTVDASGSATVSARLERTNELAFTGAAGGTLETTLSRTLIATLQGDGNGTLSLSTDRTRPLSMGGFGSSTADATIDRAKEPTFNGSASSWFESPSISRTRSLSYTALGTGDGSFNIHLEEPDVLALLFNADGSATGDISVSKRRGIAYDASGGSSADFRLERATEPTFNGSGNGTLDTTLNRERPATLHGNGSATVSIAADRPRSISYTGSGSSTADVNLERAHELSLAASGSAWFESAPPISRTRRLSYTGLGQSVGAFNIRLEEPDVLALIFNAAGSARGDISTTRTRTASLTGSGAATASLGPEFARETELSASGTGVFNTTPSVVRTRALSYDASGTANADITRNATRSVSYDATGTSSITLPAYRTKPVTLDTSASGVLESPTVTRVRTLAYGASGTATAAFRIDTIGSEPIESIIRLEGERVLVTTLSGERHVLESLSGERIPEQYLNGEI